MPPCCRSHPKTAGQNVVCQRLIQNQHGCQKAISAQARAKREKGRLVGVGAVRDESRGKGIGNAKNVRRGCFFHLLTPRVKRGDPVHELVRVRPGGVTCAWTSVPQSGVTTSILLYYPFFFINKCLRYKIQSDEHNLFLV